MSRIAVLVAFLVLMATACTPSISPSDAKKVVIEGTQLLLSHSDGEIGKAHWPSSILALEPKSVHASPEGLYICTSEFFVEERGFFVPRQPGKVVATSGTDPSYIPVVSGLFTYRVKG